MGSGLLRAFAVTLALSVLPALATAQANEISEADYWAAIRAAFNATSRVFPRKEIEIFEGSRAGRTYRRTKVSEYAAADKFHLTTERVEGDTATAEEMIQVGKERYCKKGLAEWSTANCYVNPPAALEDAIKSQFQVEKGEEGITYTRRSTFLLNQPGGSEPTEFLTEDVLELNSDLSIRKRTITKSAVGTRVVLSREMRKHEYALELKSIEAPIK